MAIRNIAPGMLKTWSKRKTKDIRLSSFWENLSNRSEQLPSIPNAKDHKVPKDVLHYVQTEFQRGTYSATIPLLENLRQDGKGGLQVAEGSGETPEALYAIAFWNVSRKVANVNTEGVENEATKYLEAVKEAHSMLMDWFAEDNDFGCQMAIIEGGDRYITTDKYWADYQEQKVAPLSKLIHPNIAFPGMNAAIARNFANYSYASDMAAIKTALAALAPSDGFSLAALDGAIDYARRFVKPLSWAAGSEKVNYIILISPMQALQLMRDQVWIDLMRGAEKRGPDNRAISGVLGIRHGALIVEDMRSPILNLASNAFEYVTVTEANASDSFYGFGKLNRSPKGAAGQATGTVEIARVLGQGAIGVPLVHDVEFERNEKDFTFQKELCGIQACGHNRLDFKGKNKDGTGRVKNISSALYFTSTPAISY